MQKQSIKFHAWLMLAGRKNTRQPTTSQTVPSAVTKHFKSNITCVSHSVREGEGGGYPGTILRDARVFTANLGLTLKNAIIYIYISYIYIDDI